MIERRRATKVEMLARFDDLFSIVEAQRPVTVRQTFYQATVRGLVEKTEGGCAKIGDALTQMRRSGRIPYAWITDSTRLMHKPRSFSGIAQAIDFTARTYRRALWQDVDAYVEIWIEKDALAGTLIDVTSEYDVPLMSARGYSSLSFLYSAAEAMSVQGKPCHVYHLGDWDPSGVDASRKICETLHEMAPDVDILFERVAVTPAQIEVMNLPSRPTKTTDTRTKNWNGGDSVELDALPPDYLRGLVRSCIARHINEEDLAIIKVAEASEREALRSFAHEAHR
jgi:hypothetical protein